ncbi:hypothetical protein Btru_013912 [Bulinus truncatus]|nr:hypothetical protein Btru_013912 [Bulinus truncatus]
MTDITLVGPTCGQIQTDRQTNERAGIRQTCAGLDKVEIIVADIDQLCHAADQKSRKGTMSNGLIPLCLVVCTDILYGSVPGRPACLQRVDSCYRSCKNIRVSAVLYWECRKTDRDGQSAVIQLKADMGGQKPCVLILNTPVTPSTHDLRSPLWRCRTLVVVFHMRLWLVCVPSRTLGVCVQQNSELCGYSRTLVVVFTAEL